MQHVFPSDLIPIEALMTRQRIFDRVVRHFRAQPRRCPAHGVAHYRLDGDRCFVGQMIDDESYDKAMEGHGVIALWRFDLPAWFRDNLAFIKELQTVHDNQRNWPADRMQVVLERFAAERGLTMPA